MPKVTYDAKIEHFSLAELTGSVRPQRWVLDRPVALVMMFPCYDGKGYIAALPPAEFLLGAGHNQFITPDGIAYSVVSLVLHGLVRKIKGQWHIVASSQGRSVEFKLHREADLGIIHGELPRQALAPLLEAYVRENPPSRIIVRPIPA